jgi:hypothetical protein
MKTITAIIFVVLFYSNAFAGRGNCYDYLTEESWGSCVYHADCQEEPSEWWKWCEGLPDVDGDGIVDSYDPDTLFGFISGQNKVGVSITIARVVDAVCTDEDGYYAFGELEAGDYALIPTDNQTWFHQLFEIVTVD